MTEAPSRDDFVRAVRDAIDIVDLAASITKLERRGERYVALCPFHQEKTPSLSIDPRRGLYYCFGCGQGGDAIKLHMETSGDDFKTALEVLARRYGVPLPRYPGADRGAARSAAALEAAAQFFSSELERSAVAQRYLERRGVDRATRERFALGYAPDDWRRRTEPHERRVALADLESAGLVLRSQKSGRPYDRFRHRLMFPIHGPSGRLVGFGGRTLGEDQAKYVNTAETEAFQKKALLYGLHLARTAARERGALLLVEGYFDVIAAHRAGMPWAVASMGTALTLQQVALLRRHVSEVIVGYDGDRAGEEAARKALFLLLRAGVQVRRARFPAGQDPDSLLSDAGAEAVARVVAEAPDAVVLEIERVPEGPLDPSSRARHANVLRELVREVPDPVLRFAYGQHAAQRLGVPENVFWGRPGGGPETPAAGRTPSRSSLPGLEERLLEQLLLGVARSTPIEALPEPAAFFDPACRRIYRAYLVVREDPSVGLEEDALERAILSVLRASPESASPEGAGLLDRMASFLLQEPARLSETELRDAARQLERRHQQSRQKQLARELQEAQSAGDQPRLERLLQEKAELSRKVHPG